MGRRSPQVKLWVFGSLTVCVLLAAVFALHPAVSVGRTRVAWRLTRGWGIYSWSGRVTEWDETYPPQPPCQFYQVRREQFGLVLVETSRRVSPRPGEVCQ